MEMAKSEVIVLKVRAKYKIIVSVFFFFFFFLIEKKNILKVP
jgi:hypothetical protein